MQIHKQAGRKYTTQAYIHVYIYTQYIFTYTQYIYIYTGMRAYIHYYTTASTCVFVGVGTPKGPSWGNSFEKDPRVWVL